VILMTEEEKRELALSLLAAEQARLRSASLLDTTNTRLQASLARSERQRKVFASLAQQGITWEDLKRAYDEAFQRGHEAMLDFKLSYFYAGAAIAVSERYDTTPEACADLIRMLLDIAEEFPEKADIVKAALEMAGVDTSILDEDGATTAPGRARMSNGAKATRKDQQAIARMQRTGITEADLEYERSVGYDAGWNSGFGYSVCFASLAIALSRTFQSDADEIEAVFDRIRELEYEEISAADIIERARQEAGVDVSNLITSEG